MKKQLTDEILMALRSYIPDPHLEDAEMVITMILNDYQITQEERSLIVYEQDETQLMIKKFLAAKIAKGCSARTVSFYSTEVTKALMKIGKPFNEVTADDVRYLLAMRVQNDGVSKTTANNERRALSSFYQWLQKEEILLKNPMNKVDNIKVTKKKPKAFSKMEVELIRDACRTARETAVIEILLSTWARVTELVEIRIEDIQENHITVHGKGDKLRDVYLTPKAQLAIRNYLSERSDSNPYLFPKAKYAGNWQEMQRSQKGIQKRTLPEWYKDPSQVDEERHTDASSMESIVRNIGKRAGVNKVHPHRFRRTGATFALRSGMPILQVSKLLGHEQISTTQIYLDISDEELMQAHERFTG